MPNAKYPSETADRFQVRLPDGLRDEIRDAAEANGRSMNAEIVHRLSFGVETVRDTLAAQALIGMGLWSPMPDEGMPSLNTAETLRDRANWAYSQADAMLAARKAGA